MLTLKKLKVCLRIKKSSSEANINNNFDKFTISK